MTAGADRTAPPRTLRALRPWLWVLVGIASLVLGALLARHLLDDGAPPKGASDGIGSHFTLVDRAGKTVTAQTLKGQPYAIFFGFTRCPDVCPTTLSRMAHLRKMLGKDGDKFRIVFVSVDSGHDKPADVGAYVDLFGTPIMGLTGSDDQIAYAARSFRVFYKKVPVEGSNYTIDHSAFVVLMDRNGLFKSILSDADSEEAALSELRAIIA